MYRSLLLALPAAFLLACSSAKQTTTTARPDTTAMAGANAGADALEKLRASYQTTPQLLVKGQMSASGIPVTIWFESVVKGYDSVKIILTGPFGIPVGAMSATPERFVFYNAQQGEVVEGRPDRETLAQVMQVGLDYRELVGLMRGELCRIPAAGSYVCRATDRRDELDYSLPRGAVSEGFQLDTAAPAVMHYRRARADKAELDIVYKSFMTVGGRKFPRNGTVDVNNGQQNIRVTVEHVDNNLGRDDICTITVPADVPRRKL